MTFDLIAFTAGAALGAVAGIVLTLAIVWLLTQLIEDPYDY